MTPDNSNSLQHELLKAMFDSLQVPFFLYNSIELLTTRTCFFISSGGSSYWESTVGERFELSRADSSVALESQLELRCSPFCPVWVVAAAGLVAVAGPLTSVRMPPLVVHFPSSCFANKNEEKCARNHKQKGKKKREKMNICRCTV